MKNRLFWSVILLIIGSQLIAQNQLEVVNPAPTSYELGQYGNVPVSLYYGTPGISIPLWTAKERDIQVPISLSYRSGGIKVDENSSWIGLRWSLNAGGVITREIRGAPDKQPGTDLRRIFTNTMTVEEASNLSLQVKLRSTTGKDSEPDLFTFNFLNYNGKFHFDADGNIMLTSEKDIQIFFELNPDGSGDLRFRVIDDQGFIYLFNETETVSDFASSWYLTSITSANGSRVNFEYRFEAFDTYALPNAYTHVNFNGGFIGPSTSYTLNRVTNKALRVSRIIPESGEWEIVFDPGSETRLDLSQSLGSPKNLDKIRVLDRGGAVIKTFNLTHDYFYANPGYLFEQTGIPVSNPNLFTHLNYRLKLTGIDEISSTGEVIKSHRFGYYGDDGNTSHILPCKLSFAQDHWGYFNRENNNSLIPSFSLYPYTSKNITVPGANREPNESSAVAGLLKYITYPTGASSHFAFESNKVEQGVVIAPQYSTKGEYLELANGPVELTDTFETLYLPNSRFNLYYDVQDFNGDMTWDIIDGIEFEISNENGEILTGKTRVWDLQPGPGQPIFEIRFTYGNENKRMDYYPNQPSPIKVLFNDGNELTLEAGLDGTFLDFRLEGTFKMPSGTTTVRYKDQSMYEFGSGGDFFGSLEVQSSGRTSTQTEYTNMIAGGVRVASITEKDEYGGIIKTKSYDYKSGEAVINNSYTSYAYNGRPVNYEVCTDEGQVNGSIRVESRSLYSHNDSPVGFKKVIEYTSGNGSIEYNYLGYNIHNNEYLDYLADYLGPVYTYYDHQLSQEITVQKHSFRLLAFGILTDGIWNNPYQYYSSDIYAYPYDYPNSQEWKRGKLQSKKIYNELGELLEWVENSYEFIENPPTAGSKFVYFELPIYDDTFCSNLKGFADIFYINNYLVTSGWSRMRSSKITRRIPSSNDELVSTTTYDYQSDHHKKPTRITTTTSEGNVKVIENSYPPDNPVGTSTASSVLTRMTNDNLIAPVIKQQTYLNGVLSGGTHMNFEVDANNHVVHTDSEQMNTVSGNYEITYELKKDQFGNTVETKARDGLVNSYTWNYSQTLPVIKAVNPTINFGATIESSSVLPSGYSTLEALLRDLDDIATNSAKQTLWKFYNKTLRNHPENANTLIYTYTYKPLIGITSETDANGLTRYYKYDDFNRLKYIKDADGNILSAYEYHYKQ